MKEPGLDNRHRDKTPPKAGEIQQKRGDTLNKNLPKPIRQFRADTKLETMRKETGKTSEEAVRRAAKRLRMIVTAEIGTGQLADLIKQVQAGDEVVLTQGNKPVAKLVSALEETASPRAALQIRSLEGHRVLTPIISQEDVAEEMFSRQ